jgi:hypothetical protein
MQAYALTVDKKGLKIQETAAEGGSAIEPQPNRIALAMRRTRIPAKARPWTWRLRPHSLKREILPQNVV